jgi:glyoxylase-like metal-dependent hydrolase (beta-lactamase superfamily II)
MDTEFKRWRIGRIQVTRINELGPVPIDVHHLLPAATPEDVKAQAWLAPRYATESGQIMLNFQCFLVEADGRRILVDTCIGDHKQLENPGFSGRVTGFLETLRRAGAGPDDVDTVLCTHLHFDHVGWNTQLVDGAWRPTFPNARYLFGRDELAFASGETPDEGDSHFAQSVQPILDAGLADLVAGDHAICLGVRLVPTPGHTPGHVSVWLESDGEQGVISGDAVHHPLQFARPEFASGFCHDLAQSCATRRSLLSRLEDRPVLFIGTHFCEPTAGRVVKDGAAWRFEAVEPALAG